VSCDGLGEELRVEDRGRGEHDPGHALVDHVLDLVVGTDPSAGLDVHPLGKDPPQRGPVVALVQRRVEVHDVEPRSSFLDEGGGRGRGIVRVAGLLFRPSPDQPDHAASAEVDRGDDDHAAALTRFR
jgi:hypothetical protein